MSVQKRGRRLSASSHEESLGEVIQSEIIPRLMISHRVGPVPPSLGAALGRRLTESDRAEFLRRVRGEAEGAAQEFVQQLVDGGVPVEVVYLDLLAPAARALGEDWERDHCDFVEVTVALGRMQRVLRTYSRFFVQDVPNEQVVGRALLSCLPGEQHTLGLFMVGEFLLRAGWAVSVGAPVMQVDLADTVRLEWLDVVGFSVASERAVPQLAREVRSVRRHARNPNVQVIVGGPVFLVRPELAQEVGADGWAEDAAAVPALAAQLLEQASH